MTDRTPRSNLVSISDLTVAFEGVKALDTVSLDIAAGERVALLGHNGAGKSTLFRVVLGFLEPVCGTITVGGAPPGSDAARRAVSYLPEAVAFPKTLTGTEVLAFFCRLKSESPAVSSALLETVGIADAADRRVGTYSKGMRQRLGLAQALIGKPEVLLLDEPTSGLDPISRREFYEIIDRVAGEGTAVLLSSHSLTEVEARTDRVAILSHGRLVADGPLAELASDAQLPVTIRVKARDGAADSIWQKIGGMRHNGQAVVLSCAPKDKLDVLSRIAGLRDIVLDVDIAMPHLDEVYKYYSDRARPGGKS